MSPDLYSVTAQTVVAYISKMSDEGFAACCNHTECEKLIGLFGKSEGRFGIFHFVLS
jgi:uncharacterized protein YehS (DUF1456 family)